MADGDDTKMSFDDSEIQRDLFRRRLMKSEQDSQMSIDCTVRHAPAPKPYLLFMKPDQIVTVIAGGEKFFLHKELLVKDSSYFETALNGPFQESITQTVELDDISPADFGFYAHLLGALCYFIPSPTQPKFVLRKEQLGGTLSTKQILSFWQTADRFVNAPLTKVAKESLDHRLGLYSEIQWRKLFQRKTKPDIEDRMRRLQEAYFQCIDGSIPFEADIVAAAANCPSQVYIDTVHVMEAEFMAAVSKKAMMRHADPTLTKKRPAEDQLQPKINSRSIGP